MEPSESFWLSLLLFLWQLAAEGEVPDVDDKLRGSYGAKPDDPGTNHQQIFIWPLPNQMKQILINKLIKLIVYGAKPDDPETNHQHKTIKNLFHPPPYKEIM